MARYDYNKEHFERVKVCGIPCLATEIFPGNLGRKIVKAEEIHHESDYISELLE